MEDKELQLLHEIDTLRKKILMEPNGQRIGQVLIEPCSSRYCQIVNELVEKVRELRSVTQEDYAQVLDQHIGSVLGREVEHVQSATLFLLMATARPWKALFPPRKQISLTSTARPCRPATTTKER